MLLKKMNLLFIVLTLAFPTLVHSITKNQKAFYAISSLLFYLDSEEEENSNTIFSQEDIQSLWDRALNSELEDIILAKNCYEKASITHLESQNLLDQSKKHLFSAWQNLNPYWTSSTKDLIAKAPNFHDYVLTEHSPLWPNLSSIFNNKKCLNTPSHFKRAGFKIISERPSGLFIARHPDLPGYVVKAYIKSEKIKLTWTWCIHRCWGVSNIRELIQEKNLKHFIVPDKWIYPFFPEGEIPQDLFDIETPAVLVATDMQLVTKSESRAAWREIPTKEHIQELYCILSHGYSSCSLPSNIPYTIHKKFACIDTEHPQRELPFHHVPNHLSKEMGKYWDYLVKTGGKGMEY